MKIDTVRELYNKIAHQEPYDPTPKPANKEVLEKSVEHLNKTPIFTPKVK